MEAVLRKKEFYGMSDFKEYTIADIEALPEGQRAELFDGEMFMMETPTLTHQAILGWLYVEIYSKIRDKNGKCKVFAAPCGVYIKDDDKNYVEPDVVVICDKDKLDNKGCHGAPDWIVEIVSPSSKRMDYYKKLNAYAEAGVREYWIIDPSRKVVVVNKIEATGIPEIHSFLDTIKVEVLEDFEIDFFFFLDYDYGPEE